MQSATAPESYGLSHRGQNHVSLYGVLEQKPKTTPIYLTNILDFAKRVSNIADEASKVMMKTVRRELIGTGYYAKYRFDDIIGESENIQDQGHIS